MDLQGFTTLDEVGPEDPQVRHQDEIFKPSTAAEEIDYLNKILADIEKDNWSDVNSNRKKSGFDNEVEGKNFGSRNCSKLYSRNNTDSGHKSVRSRDSEGRNSVRVHDNSKEKFASENDTEENISESVDENRSLSKVQKCIMQDFDLSRVDDVATQAGNQHTTVYKTDWGCVQSGLSTEPNFDILSPIPGSDVNVSYQSHPDQDADLDEDIGECNIEAISLATLNEAESSELSPSTIDATIVSVSSSCECSNVLELQCFSAGDTSNSYLSGENVSGLTGGNPADSDELTFSNVVLGNSCHLVGNSQVPPEVIQDKVLEMQIDLSMMKTEPVDAVPEEEFINDPAEDFEVKEEPKDEEEPLEFSPTASMDLTVNCLRVKVVKSEEGERLEKPDPVKSAEHELSGEPDSVVPSVRYLVEGDKYYSREQVTAALIISKSSHAPIIDMDMFPNVGRTSLILNLFSLEDMIRNPSRAVLEDVEIIKLFVVNYGRSVHDWKRIFKYKKPFGKCTGSSKKDSKKDGKGCAPCRSVSDKGRRKRGNGKALPKISLSSIEESLNCDSTIHDNDKETVKPKLMLNDLKDEKKNEQQTNESANRLTVKTEENLVNPVSSGIKTEESTRGNSNLWNPPTESDLRWNCNKKRNILDDIKGTEIQGHKSVKKARKKISSKQCKVLPSEENSINVEAKPIGSPEVNCPQACKLSENNSILETSFIKKSNSKIISDGFSSKSNVDVKLETSDLKRNTKEIFGRSQQSKEEILLLNCKPCAVRLLDIAKDKEYKEVVERYLRLSCKDMKISTPCEKINGDEVPDIIPDSLPDIDNESNVQPVLKLLESESMCRKDNRSTLQNFNCSVKIAHKNEPVDTRGGDGPVEVEGKDKALVPSTEHEALDADSEDEQMDTTVKNSDFEEDIIEPKGVGSESLTVLGEKGKVGNESEAAVEVAKPGEEDDQLGSRELGKDDTAVLEESEWQSVKLGKGRLEVRDIRKDREKEDVKRFRQEKRDKFAEDKTYNNLKKGRGGKERDKKFQELQHRRAIAVEHEVKRMKVEEENLAVKETPTVTCNLLPSITTFKIPKKKVMNDRGCKVEHNSILSRREELLSSKKPHGYSSGKNVDSNNRNQRSQRDWNSQRKDDRNQNSISNLVGQPKPQVIEGWSRKSVKDARVNVSPVSNVGDNLGSGRNVLRHKPVMEQERRIPPHVLSPRVLDSSRMNPSNTADEVQGRKPNGYESPMSDHQRSQLKPARGGDMGKRLTAPPPPVVDNWGFRPSKITGDITESSYSGDFSPADAASSPYDSGNAIDESDPLEKHLSGENEHLCVDYNHQSKYVSEFEKTERELKSIKIRSENLETELENRETDLINGKTGLENKNAELENGEAELANRELKSENVEERSENRESKSEKGERNQEKTVECKVGERYSHLDKKQKLRLYEKMKRSYYESKKRYHDERGDRKRAWFMECERRKKEYYNMKIYLCQEKKKEHEAKKKILREIKAKRRYASSESKLERVSTKRTYSSVSKSLADVAQDSVDEDADDYEHAVEDDGETPYSPSNSPILDLADIDVTASLLDTRGFLKKAVSSEQLPKKATPTSISVYGSEKLKLRVMSVLKTHKDTSVPETSDKTSSASVSQQNSVPQDCVARLTNPEQSLSQSSIPKCSLPSVPVSSSIEERLRVTTEPPASASGERCPYILPPRSFSKITEMSSHVPPLPPVSKLIGISSNVPPHPPVSEIKEMSSCVLPHPPVSRSIKLSKCISPLTPVSKALEISKDGPPLPPGSSFPAQPAMPDEPPLPVPPPVLAPYPQPPTSNVAYSPQLPETSPLVSLAHLEGSQHHTANNKLPSGSSLLDPPPLPIHSPVAIPPNLPPATLVPGIYKQPILCAPPTSQASTDLADIFPPCDKGSEHSEFTPEPSVVTTNQPSVPNILVPPPPPPNMLFKFIGCKPTTSSADEKGCTADIIQEVPMDIESDSEASVLDDDDDVTKYLATFGVCVEELSSVESDACQREKSPLLSSNQNLRELVAKLMGTFKRKEPGFNSQQNQGMNEQKQALNGNSHVNVGSQDIIPTPDNLGNTQFGRGTSEDACDLELKTRVPLKRLFCVDELLMSVEAADQNTELEVISSNIQERYREKRTFVDEVPEYYQKVPLAQAVVDKCKDIPLVGLQYVLEVRQDVEVTLDGCYYICAVCSKKMNANTLIAHVKSVPHRLKFSETHCRDVFEKYGAYSLKQWTATLVREFTLALAEVEAKMGRQKLAVAFEKDISSVLASLKQKINDVNQLSEPKEKNGEEREKDCVSPDLSAADNELPPETIPLPSFNTKVSTGKSETLLPTATPSREKTESITSNHSAVKTTASSGLAGKNNDGSIQQKSTELQPEGTNDVEIIEVKKSDGKFSSNGQGYRKRNYRPGPNAGRRSSSQSPSRSMSPVEKSHSRLLSPKRKRGSRSPSNKQMNRSRSPSRTLHGRHRSRSRSPSRHGSPSRRKRIKDKGIFPRSGHRKRRHSRSPSSPSRNRSRSRSRSLHGLHRSRSRSRSRHRSPSRRKRDSPDDRSKGITEKKLKEFREAEAKIKAQHKNKMAIYEKHPESHPEYNREWKAFWERRCYELEAQGIDPFQHDFKNEWAEFWQQRIRELMATHYKSRRKALLLGINMEDPDLILKNSGSKKGGDSLSNLDKSKRDALSRIDRSPSPWEDESRNNSCAKNPSPPRELGSVGVEPPKTYEEEFSVIGTLRLLNELEDQLGSFGPAIKTLLDKAVDCSAKSSDAMELFNDPDNLVLVRYAREKLSSQVSAGILGVSALVRTQMAVERAMWIQSEAEKLSSKEKYLGLDIASIARATLGKDKIQIAQFIAQHLLQVGNSNASEEDLQNILIAVSATHSKIIIEQATKQAQNRSAEPTQNSLSASPTKINPQGPSTTSSEASQTPQPLFPSATHSSVNKSPPSVSVGLSMLQSAYEDESAKDMERLSLEDLRSLLANFRSLVPEEQHALTSYLKKLEATDSKKVMKLRAEMQKSAKNTVKKGLPTSKTTGFPKQSAGPAKEPVINNNTQSPGTSTSVNEQPAGTRPPQTSQQPSNVPPQPSQPPTGALPPQPSQPPAGTLPPQPSQRPAGAYPLPPSEQPPGAYPPQPSHQYSKAVHPQLIQQGVQALKPQSSQQSGQALLPQSSHQPAQAYPPHTVNLGSLHKPELYKSSINTGFRENHPTPEKVHHPGEPANQDPHSFPGRSQSPRNFQGRSQSPHDFQGRSQSPPNFQGRSQSPPNFQGRSQSPRSFQGRSQSPRSFQGRSHSPLSISEAFRQFSSDDRTNFRDSISFGNRKQGYPGSPRPFMDRDGSRYSLSSDFPPQKYKQYGGQNYSNSDINRPFDQGGSEKYISQNYERSGSARGGMHSYTSDFDRTFPPRGAPFPNVFGRQNEDDFYGDRPQPPFGSSKQFQSAGLRNSFRGRPPLGGAPRGQPPYHQPW